MCSYLVATGSSDNTCKIWDIRGRDCLYTVPAHTSLVSSLAFGPNNGSFLATASYDATAKVNGMCRGGPFGNGVYRTRLPQ